MYAWIWMPHINRTTKFGLGLGFAFDTSSGIQVGIQVGKKASLL